MDIYMKMLFFFAVASSAAWPLLFAGLQQRRDSRERNVKETTRTTGRIVEYKTRVVRTGKGGSRTYHIPVIEYTANFLDYRQDYDSFYDPKKHPVGEMVEILYDFRDPQHFHLAEDPVFTEPGEGAIKIAVIWIIIALALTFALAIFVGGLRFDFSDLPYLWYRLKMLLHIR